MSSRPPAEVPDRVAVTPPYLAFTSPNALRHAFNALAAQPGWDTLPSAPTVVVHAHRRMRVSAHPAASNVHQIALEAECYSRSGLVNWSSQLRTGVPDELLLAFARSLATLPDISPPYEGDGIPSNDVLQAAGWTPYSEALDPDDPTEGLGSPDGMADVARSISPAGRDGGHFWRLSAGVQGQMWSASLSRDAPVSLVNALVRAMASNAPAIRERTHLLHPDPDLAPYLAVVPAPAPAGRVLAATAHSRRPVLAAPLESLPGLGPAPEPAVSRSR
ncbi:hypothetical protein ABH940_005557 [Streptacidiphilus sp. BW17]|uniref:DUF317 domain-containing protein n=1 Tax=Streptacidiphilus sp. BW17 TaxID=3156274 RepID=UPI003510E7F1